MTKSSTFKYALSGHAIFLALLFYSLSSLASDTVTREISCEHGVVWVEDKLHISGDFAVSDNDLGNVYDAAKDRKTNLLAHIRTMLKGEDLEIRDFKVDFKDEILDLKIRSTIKITEPDKPAGLHWVSTLGGCRAVLKSEDSGLPGREMLVFSHDGKHVLWTPNLSSREEEVLTFDEFFARPDPLRFECMLKSGGKTERLLRWEVGSKATGIPDATLTKRIKDFHKLSGNDEYNLYTSLQIAKSGYYRIAEDVEAAKEQNRSPIKKVKP